jgi:hypothetical protein
VCLGLLVTLNRGRGIVLKIPATKPSGSIVLSVIVLSLSEVNKRVQVLNSTFGDEDKK